MFSTQTRQKLLLAKSNMAQTGQRAPMFIEGEVDWTLDAAKEVLALFSEGLADEPAADSVLWFSERAPEGSWQLPADKINHELGREAEYAVFDLFSGFHPDALAAMSGSIRAGGLLLVLCPPLSLWEQFEDPLASRIAVEPWGSGGVKKRFTARAAWLLEAFPHKIRLTQGADLADIPPAEPARPLSREPDDWGCITPGQRQAVEAVLHVVSGHRRRPLVLEADRGRGKSAAMGIAVASLISQGKQVVVTAPRPENVDTFMRYAKAANAQGEVLRFFAPDHLLEVKPEADLLVVDEAAAIAPELLKAMLQQYKRVVLATTVNGYEGTGRGFAIRFQHYLETCFPGWVKCTLQEPIRWNPGDWLETCLNSLLLLNPGQADTTSGPSLHPMRFGEFIYQCNPLAERRLQEVFELLIAAHYRTRPSDLRTLLDGGNVRLFTLAEGADLKAVAMVAREGELCGGLAADILAGSRRPHGQILPQTLAVHLGQDEALGLSHWRVVRIAVQPEAQGNGLGSELLAKLSEHAQAEGMDAIGSLFSGNQPVLNFWEKNQYSTLRVGYTRESTTGAYSLLVLKGLSAAGIEVAQRARRTFCEDFPLSLLDAHRCLPPELVLAIISDPDFLLPTNGRLPTRPVPLERDQRNLDKYVAGYTPYENVAPSIWRMLWTRPWDIGRQVADVGPGRGLLVMKGLQNRPWEECIARLGLSGKKQARNILRQSISEWMRPPDQLAD